MGKPTRVAMIMGKMVGGGVESVVMNYYRHIDKKQFQFDFIIDEDSTNVPEQEILALGGRIFKVSPYQKLFKYKKDLTHIFNEEKYDIVHSHINSLSVFPLGVAKRCNIPIRIAHSHSTSAPGEHKKNFLKSVLKMFSKKYATNFMAPTKYAGEWLFGKEIAENNLYILKNAIELDKFLFNESIRKNEREKLGISSESFVIGNIGRLVWQKNQEFVIDVFNHYKDINKQAKLVLVGEGPDEEKLIRKIHECQLDESVLLLGNKKNVCDLYQVFDVFLFPSRYEGLGIVAIEAQTSGLRVIGSDRIPKDVEITELYSKKSLDDSFSSWIQSIGSQKLERKSRELDMINAGYDIERESIKLADYYKKILTERKRG